MKEQSLSKKLVLTRKKIILILVVLFFIIGIIIFARIFVNGGEDTWIKDSRGVWIKHGNPSETPNYILEQQELMSCAFDKFTDFAEETSSEEISSQCLGICGDYAIDIVHVPRTTEDDLEENQCADFREGRVSHFIELDRFGEIVRIN